MLKFPGRRPTNLGVRDGKVVNCPSSPNCVSSQAHDAGHAIEPLPLSGGPVGAMQRLKNVIQSMPRTQVVESKTNYLYAEFTMPLRPPSASSIGRTVPVRILRKGQPQDLTVRPVELAR